jgi:hypothetical protein
MRLLGRQAGRVRQALRISRYRSIFFRFSAEDTSAK